MIEIFFKKIIQGQINTVNQLDMIHDNLIMLRKEVRDFFEDLINWTEIMRNLGDILIIEFDKQNFISYDDIMETEGLKGIYNLFIEKIKSSIMQIVEKLRANSKFTNAYYYFIKDFIFFYFIIKSYSEKLKLNFKVEEYMGELKQSFVDKFNSSCGENFNRAFNLVKSVEKMAESTGRFEKENLVNIQIIDHLVKYIKFMSLCFVEINEDLFLDKNLIKEDPLLKELQTIFSQALMENYIKNIFARIEEVIEKLMTENNQLLVQKFYFFYYILYKMNEVVVSFINSNIPFLINETIQIQIQENLNNFMNRFYNCFMHRIIKDLKMLIINKEISYL